MGVLVQTGNQSLPDDRHLDLSVAGRSFSHSPLQYLKEKSRTEICGSA
jgi:hypothetical protein